MNTNCVSRFAPSPTGALHLGHAYSALCAHDVARQAGGQFLLRIEDIDQGRSRAEHVAGIVEDLAWLGLDWDGPLLSQTSRTAAYDAALTRLIEAGLAYKCWCTRAEIAAAGGAPQGDQLVYPGTCRGRTDPDPSRTFCWRLDVAAAMTRTGPLLWADRTAGEVVARPDLMGDVVIARKDAGTSYHMAVVIDDAWQNVTDVVRGVDLFSSTHIHRLLQALLDLPVPRYWHHPLVVDAAGSRLAKRKSSLSLAALRDSGVDPVSLVTGLRAGQLPLGYRLSTDPAAT